MVEQACSTLRRAGMVAALIGLMVGNAIAEAKQAELASEAAVGRIDFDNASLPPANVELDLSQGMFENLFGIGDAAVAGVAETLLKSANGDQADTTRLAAEQLAAVRQVIGLTGKVVKEVRVRAYEGVADDLSPRFEKQIRDGEWEKMVVLRHDEGNACVYAIRQNEAIRGIFVVAGSDEGQVLVNVVCDVSPGNVKQLTSAATKIGIDNGLLQKLEAKIKGSRGSRPVGLVQPKPPVPPSGPAVK